MAHTQRLGMGWVKVFIKMDIFWSGAQKLSHDE